MKTSLVLGLLAGAAILIAIAFLARSWRALALIVPITLYLSVGSFLGPPKPVVAVTRTVSRARTAVGQEVEIRLRIVNEGPRIPSLEVFDNLPANLEVVKGRPHVHVEVRPRQAAGGT